MNNVIKKHELTRADKEQDRINHVDYCDANTGPIFLTYRDNATVGDIVKAWQAEHEPVYDFVSDGVAQTVWVIDCPETTVITAPPRLSKSAKSAGSRTPVIPEMRSSTSSSPCCSRRASLR